MTVFKIDVVKILYILGAAVLLFLLFRGCKDNEKYINELKALNSKYDSIVKLKEESDQRIAVLNSQDSSYLVAIDSLKGELASGKKVIYVKTKKVNDLATTIISHTGPADDEYKKVCDSLAQVCKQREQDLVDYQNSVDLMINNYDSSLKVKDNIIVEQKGQIVLLKNMLEEYKKSAETVINKLKPRNQVYLGGDVVGGRQDILYGYGLSGTLVNKKGQAYTAGVYKLNNETFYSAGIKFRLSFRKK